MDSLGRRFYGVSERTYERDFKQYMKSIPLETLPAKVHVEERREVQPQNSSLSSNLETTKNVLKTMLTIIVIVALIRLIKKIYDEMELLNQERELDQETGDPLDRIFGSEYQSKFRNSVVNRDSSRLVEEESRLRGVKDASKTTREEDIRKLIPTPDGNLLNGLRTIINHTEFPKTDALNLFMKSVCRENLFRIMFMGYTFRELMSSSCEAPYLLPQASSYILSSIS